MNSDGNKDLIIDNEVIAPGEQSIIRLNVGRLPSGTRIFIYLHVYRGLKSGPTMLVMGGLHGDEINGVQIVKQCILEGTFNGLNCGSIIAVPLLNVHGFIHYSRDLPDGKDVNRSFPGTMKGSLASRVARTLTKKILPHVDFGIDLHTGGASRYNYPQIRFSKNDSKGLELAQMFGAPFTLEKAMIRGSFRKVARDSGIPVVVFEGGEAQRYDGYSIDIAMKGLQRVLKGKGMMASAPEVNYPKRLFKKTSWIRAADAGMFLWTKSSGQRVLKGEPLGELSEPYGHRTYTVVADRNGYIIGHNNGPVVNQGDALFHIGFEDEDF